jgi:hypothetical protein
MGIKPQSLREHRGQTNGELLFNKQFSQCGKSIRVWQELSFFHLDFAASRLRVNRYLGHAPAPVSKWPLPGYRARLAATHRAAGPGGASPRRLRMDFHDHLLDSSAELFAKNNPTCAICSQRILHIDDAAIDHLEQHWHGGKTIPENARLTHRYCNFARSKFD